MLLDIKLYHASKISGNDFKLIEEVATPSTSSSSSSTSGDDYIQGDCVNSVAFHPSDSAVVISGTGQRHFEVAHSLIGCNSSDSSDEDNELENGKDSQVPKQATPNYYSGIQIWKSKPVALSTESTERFDTHVE
jgi:hypothetical protein